MKRPKKLQPVQRHYERLRDIPHGKRWRRTEPARVVNDGSSDEGSQQHAPDLVTGQRVMDQPAPRRIGTAARRGFVVVFIVTLGAAVSLDLLSSSTSFDDAPWAPWLIASLLGSAAMAILMRAEDAIHRWSGGTSRLVTAGLVLAVVGVFVLALPLLGLASSLAEEL